MLVAPRGRSPQSLCSGRRRARGTGGFTLAELHVVALIIGVLASVAVPNLQRSVYRARRSEALYALRSIHDFQVVHQVTDGEYSDSFTALGFTLQGGSQRSDGAYRGPYYTYTLSRWDLDGRANANYRATATGDLDPSDSILDIVIVENALTVLD